MEPAEAVVVGVVGIRDTWQKDAPCSGSENTLRPVGLGQIDRRERCIAGQSRRNALPVHQVEGGKFCVGSGWTTTVGIREEMQCLLRYRALVRQEVLSWECDSRRV